MSLLGSLVKPYSTSAVPSITKRCMTVCTQQIRDDTQRRGSARNAGTRLSRSNGRCSGLVPNDHDLEGIFIRSLVAASSCHEHKERSYEKPHALLNAQSSRRRKGITHGARVRFFSSDNKVRAVAVAKASDERSISKDEYKELVNTYPSFPGKKVHPKFQQMADTHSPLAPRLFLTPEQEDLPPYAPRQVLELDDDRQKKQIRLLKKLLHMSHGRVPQDKVWKAYENIPTPRARYLSDHYLKRLFRHLTWVEFKNTEGSMQRYMALMDECLEEGVHLSEDIWNTAISFSGRWVKQVGVDQVKAAVEAWMRMEDFGHRATNVTLNILFDIAARAGRYAMADTIYEELISRELPLNRYFRTSVIYAAGLRQNGDAVRKAFQDLVNAGEIVDAAVMNCVMLSLIRAGEGPAAENVFGRMKALCEQKCGTIGPRSWQGQRELGAMLNKTAIKLREERNEFQSSYFGTKFSAEDRREEIQKAAPLAPNARTYRILITHHAYTTGDIDRIKELLDEMQQANLPIHGSVFYVLFRGFALHGGYPFSPWNRSNLEQFWSEFVAGTKLPAPINPNSASSNTVDQQDAQVDIDKEFYTGNDDEILGNIDHGEEEDLENMAEHESEEDRLPYFTPVLARAAIRAFYKCAGRQRMLEVEEEIYLRWQDATADQRWQVQVLVDRLVQENNAYVR